MYDTFATSLRKDASKYLIDLLKTEDDKLDKKKIKLCDVSNESKVKEAHKEVNDIVIMNI